MPRPICRNCPHAYRVRRNYNWSDPVACRLYEKLNDGRRCRDLHEEYHKGVAPAWCPKEAQNDAIASAQEVLGRTGGRDA